jgi:excinuclease ABC subunit B
MDKLIQDIVSVSNDEPKKHRTKDEIHNAKLLKELEEEMKKAAAELDFERAMELRDIIFEMKVK